ncbi:MAG: hypothetical protein WCO21_01185 [bacterium]
MNKKMNKKIVTAVIAASMIVPFVTGAQTTSTFPGPRTPEDMRRGFDDIRRIQGGPAAFATGTLPTPKEMGQDLREGVRMIQDEKKSEIQGIRAEFQAQAEAVREQFKKQAEAVRETAKKELELKREAAKKAIEGIKDTQKKEIVLRMDQNLTAMNTNMTARYTANVDQLVVVLGNIDSRVSSAEARGLVVTSVKTALATASTSIASARAAILAQTGNTYAAIITSSSTAKADLKVIAEKLKTDLKVVETAIKSARDAVHSAAVALGQVQGTVPHIERTTSTQSTSTTQ